MSNMHEIRIEKVTLNVGAGTDQEKLKKGIKLIKNLTGIEPVKTITKKRIPTWGLRPGLPIGCKLTLRGRKAEDVLRKVLPGTENRLKKNFFDNSGNISFGIHEYINIPGFEYDPSIGIMGFQVSVTLMRPGYRIKKRRKLPSAYGKNKKISQDESIRFMESKFNVIVE